MWFLWHVNHIRLWWRWWWVLLDFSLGAM